MGGQRSRREEIRRDKGVCIEFIKGGKGKLIVPLREKRLARRRAQTLEREFEERGGEEFKKGFSKEVYRGPRNTTRLRREKEGEKGGGDREKTSRRGHLPV